MTISVFPPPSVDENATKINLRVFRVPACDYVLDDLDRQSEIPEQYQLDVLAWSAFRAFNNFDADKGSIVNSTNMKAVYDAAVKEAMKDSKRRIFEPTKIQYGDLGFTWTR